MLYPEWQTETQRKRRGHAFWPSGEELAKIPEVYETDGVPFDDKLIYLHYFCGGSDWYVAELDRETGEMFGYARLAIYPDGAEWGYTSLAGLEQLTAAGEINDMRVPGMVIVERDLGFEPAPFGAVMAGRPAAAAPVFEEYPDLTAGALARLLKPGEAALAMLTASEGPSWCTVAAGSADAIAAGITLTGEADALAVAVIAADAAVTRFPLPEETR
jgi:hypothetical protein